MRDLRIEIRAAFTGDSHRLDDALRLGALQAIGVGARGQCGQHFVLEIEHGNDHHVRRGQLRAHALGQRHAVDRRNADIDNGHVGAFPEDRFPTHQTVGRLGNDVERALERGTQSRTR